MAVTHGYGRGMRHRCLAMLLLLGVAIAGCSSSSPHAAAPPVSPSGSVSSTSPSVGVSPTPSPSSVGTPTASATPFVSAGTEAGAYAFVKAYFAELDRAYASGDVSRLVPYRLSTCSCLGFERKIRGHYAVGDSIVGESTVIDNWEFGDHGPAFARTAILFHTVPVTIKSRSKQDIVIPRERGEFAIDLRRSGTNWVVADVRYGPGPE